MRFLLLLALLSLSRDPQVSFNQHWLEQRWAYPVNQPAQTVSTISRVAAAMTRARPCAPAPYPPRFDRPDTVLDHVLRSAPPLSIVYPTERYFYFRTRVEGRTVSGNLRFTDVEHGRLHLGYFLEGRSGPNRAHTRAAAFGPNDDTLVRSWGPLVLVARRGVVRLFLLERRALAGIHRSELRGSEHLVSGVLDESGFALSLLYDETLQNFFYVLNPRLPLPERLLARRVGDTDLLVGAESGFVFVHEPESARHLLVGVEARHVRRNSFFDGPFDQVPPDLEIRDLLEAAYPYVTLGRGLDPHGVFLDRASQRVAISPYQRYDDLEDFATWIDRTAAAALTPSHRRLLLTYEAKRHFHRFLRGARAGAR